MPAEEFEVAVTSSSRSASAGLCFLVDGRGGAVAGLPVDGAVARPPANAAQNVNEKRPQIASLRPSKFRYDPTGDAVVWRSTALHARPNVLRHLYQQMFDVQPGHVFGLSFKRFELGKATLEFTHPWSAEP